MAYEIANYSVKITLIAGADLSSNAQYRFVKLNASGQAILCSATTDRAIGVLQNNPVSGGEAEVLVSGGTKLVASAAITIANGYLSTANDGRAAAVVAGTDTTRYVFGQLLTASGAAGDIVTAVVHCSTPARAA